MANNFFDQHFLRHLDLEIFNSYLESKKLPILSVTDPKNIDVCESMSKHLNQLEPDKLDLVTADFIAVRELATDGGIRAIMELTEDDEFLENLTQQSNNVARALYCFIHKPNLFDPALHLQQITSTTNFQTRAGLKRVDASEIKKKLGMFKLELSSTLQSTEGRGQHCRIDPYEFDDRVCLFANPQDHPRTYTFYQKGKLVPRVYNPSFEIIYVYYPKSGELQLSTRMRGKKQQKLFNLFNQVILDDPQPVPENQQVLNLDLLLSDGFSFKLDPDYQIESVFVSQIRLDSKYNRKNRFIVQIDDGNGMEEIIKQLNFRRLLGDNLQRYVVSQATIKFKFKQFGRSNRVTAVLTDPDRDNLSETDSNQMAKKCIREWGLINDAEPENS